MNIAGIASIEVFNLMASGQFCGEPIPHGCLGIQISSRMDINIEYYEKVEIKKGQGFALIGRCKNKFAHTIYHLVPGSVDGFANREIRLKIEEPAFCFPKIKAKRQYSFRGCLWDSVTADKCAEEYLGYKLVSVGMKKANDCGCYCKYNIPESFTTDLISKVLVIKPSSQDSFCKHANNYFNSLKE